VPLIDLITCILGAIVGLVSANAGLKEAKSISELTKSIDNFVAIFIRIIPDLHLTRQNKKIYSKTRAPKSASFLSDRHLD
jgi:hypothetical protein